MDRDRLAFLELVERLQAVSPRLAELALQYRSHQAGLNEVERELSDEPLFGGPKKVNLRRCQEFLDDLRKQENELRGWQEAAARDLLMIQAGRRVFEKMLKEMLQAERPRVAPEQLAKLQATEEEVVAGLKDLQEHGGLELHQFIGELEQAVSDRERTK